MNVLLGLRLCMLPDELLLELPEPKYDCAVVRVLLSLLLRSPLPNEGRDPLFVLFPIGCPLILPLCLFPF